MLRKVIPVVLLAAAALAALPLTGLGDRSLPVVVPTLPPELPSATGYGTEDALGLKFDQPLCIVTPPGETQRLFVCEKTGKVVVVTDLSSTPKRDVFLDLPAMLKEKHQGTLAQKVEWGLLGIAFHPEYSQNGYFFITYDFTINEGSKKLSFDRLSRFSVSKDDPNKADPDSELPVHHSLHAVLLIFLDHPLFSPSSRGHGEQGNRPARWRLCGLLLRLAPPCGFWLLRSGPSKKDSPWSGEQAIARLFYAPQEAAAEKEIRT